MSDDFRDRHPWLRRAPLPVVLLTVLLVAVGCGSDAAPGSGTAAATPDPETGATLFLRLDDADRAAGALAFADVAGGATASLVTARGGGIAIMAGPEGRGQAVRFPAVCDATTDGCPRAMLTVPHELALDPGDGDFAYGATVLLAADETAKGANIVQKGRFGSDGGQWKLQVDTLDGQPSCVVRGELGGQPTLVRVRSPHRIADGVWHQLVCVKDADGLTIRVDGDDTEVRQPAGQVSTPRPITFGSSGTGPHDDQFHGVLDDLFLRIGGAPQSPGGTLHHHRTGHRLG